MDVKLTSIFAKGEVDVSSKETEKYETDCQTMVKDLGDFITRSCRDIEKDFTIIFFPVGKNNILNLVRKQSKYLFGEPLIAPLFSTSYDENKEFKSFKKGESKIPSKMHYMILGM